jgi:hypothetical protein
LEEEAMDLSGHLVVYHQIIKKQGMLSVVTIKNLVVSAMLYTS